MSRSEARRLLAQGGVKVDGETLPADDLDVDVDAWTAPSSRSAGASSAGSRCADERPRGSAAPGDRRATARSSTSPRACARSSSGPSPTGVVTVFAVGATVGVTTMEYEPGGVADLQALLERLVPAGGDYGHNTCNADTNAHAHLRAARRRPVRIGADRRRRAGPRDLAADRPARLRRPPARARRLRARAGLGNPATLRVPVGSTAQVVPLRGSKHGAILTGPFFGIRPEASF